MAWGRSGFRWSGIAAIAGCVAFVAAPIAQAADRDQSTIFISRSVDGDVPDGASHNPSISRDQRINRIVAFDSDATNLVAGDTNGLTDVFAVERQAPLVQGGEWVPGPAQLVSHGTGGQPANGRSYAPANDGQFNGPTNCIAFVSEASNLVPGDTNGKADAFVYFLNSGKIERVSVNSHGKQANGASYDVALDGRCDNVAFTSDASNLALTKTKDPDLEGSVTKKAKGGHKQVYVHQLKATASSGDVSALNGVTYLASASTKGKPGNGDSFEPSFAYRWNGSNHRIAYTSTATNLDKHDHNGASDIYVSDLFRQGHRTFLASQTPGGQAGNGASRHPSMSEAGLNVTFATEASNLLDNDNNGVADIDQADLPGGKAGGDDAKPVKQKWVTKDYNQNATRPDGSQTNIGNAASENPEASNNGDYVTYDTEWNGFEGEPSDNETPEDELAEPYPPEGVPALTTSPFCEPQARDFEDRNGVRDVNLFTFTRVTNFLESRTSNDPLQQLRLPSHDPAISTRGNYIPYETAEPYADLNWVGEKHPEWLPDDCSAAALATQDQVRAAAAANPAANQIVMRWLGPA